jgi:hypothetical protein
MAKMLGVKCTSLTWLRILDRGWRLVRQPDNPKSVELQPLSRWKLEHEVPDSLDFTRPKLSVG